MTFIHKSSDDLPPKPVSESQATRKLRFRVSVIAVIAANRLVRWSATSCRLCTVNDNVSLGPVCSVLCIGYVPSDCSHPYIDGKSRYFLFVFVSYRICFHLNCCII